MSEPQPEPVAAPGSRVPWAAVAVAGIAFFLAEHDLGASRRDEYYGVEADALEAVAGAGQWGNRIGFTVLALVGVAFLRSGNRPWRPRGALPVLLVLFAAWSVMSLGWATDPGRTVRRLASLTFCFAGALGFGRRLGGRELCWFVVALTAGFASVGVLVEVAQGTFRPFGAGRFAGTLHPNGQGANCGFLCLAAGTLLASGDRHRRLLVGLFAAGLLLLLATKSRTTLGAMLVGLAGARLLRPTPKVIGAGFAGAWVLCCAALVATLGGADLAALADRSLNMGRAEETGTLSGRTELWELLDDYTRQRPWLGYGYGGFWTPARIDTVSGDQYWGISSAHSAYYEAALGTGLIGLGVLVLVLLAGLWRAGADFRATADPGSGLLCAILIAEVIQGFTESDLVLPSSPAFLLATALCRTAFFDPGPGNRAAPRRGVMNQPVPAVTVVVCTYNRAALLRDALDSLFKLRTDARFTYELLVVDNASTDDTPEVVAEAGRTAPVPFRGVREMVQGVAAARNRGVREATTPWIAFFDDDQIADPRWLAELMAFAAEKSTLCVGGANRLLLPAATPAGLAPVCRWMLGETMGGEEPCRAVGTLAPGAGNLLIHRTLFERVGLFDGSLKTAGEDGELFRRVEAAGIDAWYTPRAVMHHVVPGYRVETAYLRWKSLGCGRLRAERDFERGSVRVAAIAVARLGHAALVAVPRSLWFRVRGKTGAALGDACIAWRAWGYFRTALRLIAPRLFPQRAFMERLEHRSERELFPEPDAPARELVRAETTPVPVGAEGERQ